MDAAKTFAKTATKEVKPPNPAKASGAPKASADSHVFRSTHKANPVTWHAPTSVDELLRLRHEFAGTKSKLVAGNTEIGIEVNILRRKYPVLISTRRVAEMRSI